MEVDAYPRSMRRWTARLESVLMEGLKKFADPQKALLALIAQKRAGG